MLWVSARLNPEVQMTEQPAKEMLLQLQELLAVLLSQHRTRSTGRQDGKLRAEVAVSPINLLNQSPSCGLYFHGEWA